MDEVKFKHHIKDTNKVPMPYDMGFLVSAQKYFSTLIRPEKQPPQRDGLSTWYYRGVISRALQSRYITKSLRSLGGKLGSSQTLQYILSSHRSSKLIT